MTRALTTGQIARAAGVVLIGFLASGILGLLRAAIFNALFGASAQLEAFYAAQRIPELLFTLVAGGALGSSFIPVFAKYLTDDRSDQAWRLASAVMTLSALAAFVFGVLLILAAPWYMPLLYNRALYLDLAIHMTQLMLLTTVIFSISGLLMGILNSHQNFLLPALAMSMNNIGLIIGGVIFAPLLSTAVGLFAYPAANPLIAYQFLPDLQGLTAYLAPPSLNVYGLALGALLGASLHLTIQLFGLPRIGARLRFLPDYQTEGVIQVLRLMLPRVIGLGVAQINFLVNTSFATSMGVGSLIALNTAWIVMFFVLGVIGQSIGTAVFPSLSALAAANDLPGYKDRLASAIRSVLFLAFPATLGLITLGQPIIAVLFQRGAFDAEATAGTAWALAFFALGITGHALLEVLSRAFYALSDTMTPVLIGLASMLSNIILSVLFIQFVGDPGSLSRGPFAGLALANSLTTLLESAALWWILRRRIGSINDVHVISGASRALIASLLMGLAVFGLVTFFDLPSLSLTVIGSVLGVGVFFGLAFALRLEEARTIPGVLLRRFRR
ncbi:MAG: murein biosynthesis integral membrane protein MurJ [Anaerolineae bacterium]|jgi:putative peptidoglycan lipid II flippase|nr:murein biosynthesis integral membrane protein MurJ [Anaerolineae bacterium]